MDNITLIKKLRHSANWGLYGSITVILIAVIFHFTPFRITYQSPQVTRWMLVVGTVFAVLAIVMMLLTIRKTIPTLRQLDSLDDKIKGYHAFITNLYTSTLAIVFIECVLIVLMSDTSLLMVTILMVLVLFISYPNMYKMKNDLGLTDEQMQSLFGDAYIADAKTAFDQPEPYLPLADAQLEKQQETDNPQES